MASLQLNKKNQKKEQHHQPEHAPLAGKTIDTSPEWPETNWGGAGEAHMNQSSQLEEDHIEQMIQELLDHGSIELCCSDNST